MFDIKSSKGKLNICIIFFIVISLCITGYIFYNSFQKPQTSNKKSDAISKKIQSIVDPENKISAANFKKYTRKAAHVIEFGALGLSLGAIFLCLYKKNKRIFISLPLFLSLSIAVTDEFIQSFNKRSSLLKDVLIDFAGALGGLVIILLLAMLFRKKKCK